MGQYDLEVTTFQLAVLFAWNQRPKERISFENLKLATELPDAELRRTLWVRMWWWRPGVCNQWYSKNWVSGTYRTVWQMFSVYTHSLWLPSPSWSARYCPTSPQSPLQKTFLMPHSSMSTKTSLWCKHLLLFLTYEVSEMQRLHTFQSSSITTMCQSEGQPLTEHVRLHSPEKMAKPRSGGRLTLLAGCSSQQIGCEKRKMRVLSSWGYWGHR